DWNLAGQAAAGPRPATGGAGCRTACGAARQTAPLRANPRAFPKLTHVNPPSRPALNDAVMFTATALACSRGERRLFDGLDFHLDAGEWLHVKGENGAGKTTL